MDGISVQVAGKRVVLAARSNIMSSYRYTISKKLLFPENFKKVIISRKIFNVYVDNP